MAAKRYLLVEPLAASRPSMTLIVFSAVRMNSLSTGSRIYAVNTNATVRDFASDTTRHAHKGVFRRDVRTIVELPSHQQCLT